MELQKTVSVQDISLKHVEHDVSEMKRVVGRVEKTLYAAAAVLAIGGAFIGWTINTAKDVYLATHRPSAEQVHPNTVPSLPDKKLKSVDQ